jgi:hypothetical protein
MGKQRSLSWVGVKHAPPFLSLHGMVTLSIPSIHTIIQRLFLRHINNNNSNAAAAAVLFVLVVSINQ